MSFRRFYLRVIHATLLRTRLEATFGPCASGTISRTGTVPRSDAIADVVTRQPFFAERSRLTLRRVAAIATGAIAAGAISTRAISTRAISTRSLAAKPVAARAFATETIAAVTVACGPIAAVATGAGAISAIAIAAVSSVAIARAFSALSRPARRTIAARRTLFAGEPCARGGLIYADLRLCRSLAATLAATLPLARTGLRGIAAATRSCAARTLTLTLSLAALLALARARPERRVFADAIERAQLARFVGEAAAPCLLRARFGAVFVRWLRAPLIDHGLQCQRRFRIARADEIAQCLDVFRRERFALSDDLALVQRGGSSGCASSG